MDLVIHRLLALYLSVFGDITVSNFIYILPIVSI